MNNQGEWVRISGNLIEDNRQEVKDAMLDEPTGPSNIYKKIVLYLESCI